MSYSSEVLADSPVAYFRLSEPSGTTMTDASTNAHNGTYGGSPTFGATGPITTDVSDKAVTFSAGSAQYGHASHIAAYDVGDVCSLEAWIKTTSSSLGSILSRGNDGTNGGPQIRLNTAGRIELCKGNVAILVASTVTVNDGAWHHVVATKNGSTVKIYIDKVDRTGTVTNATMANPTTELDVGADFQGGAPTQYITATLDEVALYATALSSARVTAHYNAATASSAHYGPFAGKLAMVADMVVEWSDLDTSGGTTTTVVLPYYYY